jgi:hypothetical protein
MLLEKSMPHTLFLVRHSSLAQKFPSNNLAVKDILLGHNIIGYSIQHAEENTEVKI